MRPLDTTPATTVLFLDMHEVDNLHNIELVVNQAEKCPSNPILPLGDVGEWDLRRASTWAGTILFDEEDRVFKLWYFGDSGRAENFRAVGYAWSEDGIYWHKPHLGLYEYGGSKQNNIVFLSPTGVKIFDILHPRFADHFIVVKDMQEPDPARRYEGWTRIYHQKDDANAFFPIYSPDGIHWTVGPEPLGYPTVDPTNMIIDHNDPDPARRVKVYGNLGDRSSGSGHTDMGYGPDIEHCVSSPHNPVIHPKDGLEHTIHLFSVIPYEGHYVMLYDYNLWMDYYDQQGDVTVRTRDLRVPEPKMGAFVGDIRLATNRDGVNTFTRINPHQPLVARGEKGEWDSGFLVLPGAVVRDDKIYIFYTGVDESGGGLPNIPTERVTTPVRTGLATIRRDGFTYLQSRDRLTPATMTTVPLQVTSPQQAQLVVNASHLTPYRDWIEVEVLDANTQQPVEGYSHLDCTDLMREGIRIPVRWSDRETLAGIDVPEIRLRFYLYGKARLYAFTFIP